MKIFIKVRNVSFNGVTISGPVSPRPSKLTLRPSNVTDSYTSEANASHTCGAAQQEAVRTVASHIQYSAEKSTAMKRKHTHCPG